jgi:hypothetical protein
VTGAVLSALAYLQKETRAKWRNVDALKLSNLLQLDRFEEDLNITKVRLRPPSPRPSSSPTPHQPPTLTPAESDNLRRQATHALANLRQKLRDIPNP